MEVRAKKKYLRISSRKIRLVADLIRGKYVGDAENILNFTQKASAKHVRSLIHSAIASADHNYNLDPSNLYIKEIYVNEGPTLKRFRPRSQGRAYSIFKRTSHIQVVLDEKDDKKRKTRRVKKIDAKDEKGKKLKKETLSSNKESIVKKVATRQDIKIKDESVEPGNRENEQRKITQEREAKKGRFFRRKGNM